MKNRDYIIDEINQITKLCQIREKAFFTVMRQSGLTPNTIKQLKIKDVEKILEPDTPRPRKINLPQEIQKDKFGKPPTFIEEEAINYLKQYLASRTNPTGEDPLFITYSNPPQKINTHNASKTFRIQA
jgi:hypothetical protein